MASRTISLDEDAYAALRAAKRAGESFSDVVKRMDPSPGPPSPRDGRPCHA